MNEPRPPDAEPIRVAALVPTYNNAGTLLAVLRAVALVCPAVIVVNDGSTDGTQAVLTEWMAEPHEAARTVVRHAVNRGKSAALRTGFASATEAEYTHVVTIDSDGQHDASEIPALVNAARRSPTALILGVRSSAIEHCPPNSLRARRIANTLTALECGVALTDTQCGLRVYPLGLVAAVSCRAQRYGYEAEIIPRAVWAGCAVHEVPIACTYFPPESRVSHFQPYRDSLRQLRMHGGLLARALVPWPGGPRWPAAVDRHAMPAEAVRETWRWINPLRAWREVREDAGARDTAALGVALGVLIGCFPPGLHTVVAVYLARRLHLHPIMVVLGTQVGFPPFLIAAQFAVGHLLVTGSATRIGSLAMHARELGLMSLMEHLTIEYIVGIVVTAIVLTPAAFVFVRALLRLLPAPRTPEGR